MENLKRFSSRYQELNDEELQALENLFQPVTIKKMDHMMVEGDWIRDIFFINQGLFRSYYIKNGEEFTVGFFYAPLMFAEIFSIRKNEPTRLNLQALSEVDCYKANFQELEKLMKVYPRIKQVFFKLYEMLFVYGKKRQLSFIYESSKQRYLQFEQEFPRMIQEIPLQYIASYLGVKPETLSRIRKKVN